jgi:hypothetical protein
MFPNPNQQAYSLNTGTCNTTNYVVNQRDPTTNDIFYRIGTFWINQPGIKLWYLNQQSNAITLANPTGALQSTWELVSVSSLLASISDTGNTPVFPSSPSATPPDNIQLVGGTGISIVATPASNLITITATGAGNETLTGNDGIVVGPTLGNINVVGGTTAYVTGNAGTSTETINVVTTNHALLVGRGATVSAVPLAVGATNTVLLGNTAADPSFGTVPNGALTNSSVTLNSGNNITVTGGSPLSLGGTASFNVTGTTNNAIQLGNASGSLTSAAVLTNGQLLIGNTGNPPTAATLTAGAGISITNAAGSITIAASGATVLETLTGDTGGAVSPTAGNINIRGATTTFVTGTPGTSTLKTEVISAANTILYGTGLTTPSASLGPLTNGQLIIGQTGGIPVAATLTAGTNVTISNAAGAITINATGGGSGITWNDIVASQTLVANNGYICISPGAAIVLTLPTLASVGTIFEVTLDGATSWQIAQNAGQQIRLGQHQTTAGTGGSLTSTNQGDTVRIVCSVANSKFNVLSTIGAITVT